jgi:hypothetical protein
MTRYVDVDTTRLVYATRTDRCQNFRVVADAESWEQKTARFLEDMPEGYASAKNHDPDSRSATSSSVPSTPTNRLSRAVHTGRGVAELLNLVATVTGVRRKDGEGKVSTGRTLWAPAVNTDSGSGAGHTTK